MKQQINTEIIIDRPVTDVWRTLVQFNHYPQWNPFITHIHGALEVGAPLDIALSLNVNQTRKIRPRVIRVRENRELMWIGRTWVAGIFDAEHRFVFEAENPDRTRFIHDETFSGLLVPFIWFRLKPQLAAAFVNMNEALKRQVETGVDDEYD